MSERAIAKFEAGRLWLDSGFADYGSVSRFDVWMRGAQMARALEIAEEVGLAGDYARDKLAECLEALRAYDEFTGENHD